MPVALERKLRRQVNRLHPQWSKKRKNAYVFGTLRKTGWVPSHQRHSMPHRYPIGYKKCIINTLARTKFATPKMARVAMRRATQKCGKEFYRYRTR